MRLIAQLVPHGDPVSKISIVPRSRGSLGYTMQMPEEDRYLIRQDELLDRIAVMMGGRAAETIVYDEISTGASRRHQPGDRAGAPHGHRVGHEREARAGCGMPASSCSTSAARWKTTRA